MILVNNSRRLRRIFSLISCYGVTVTLCITKKILFAHLERNNFDYFQSIIAIVCRFGSCVSTFSLSLSLDPFISSLRLVSVMRETNVTSDHVDGNESRREVFFQSAKRKIMILVLFLRFLLLTRFIFSTFCRHFSHCSLRRHPIKEQWHKFFSINHFQFIQSAVHSIKKEEVYPFDVVAFDEATRRENEIAGTRNEYVIVQLFLSFTLCYEHVKVSYL